MRKRRFDALHQSDPYKEAAVAKKRAEQDLENARKTGSTQERLDASRRFNESRTQIEKMEKAAVAASKPLAEDHRRLLELGHERQRYKDSLASATEWRNGLLDAIRNAFCIKAPVKIGSSGILPRVTVENVADADHVLLDYDALELIERGKDQEGVKTFTGTFTKVRVLVSGVDTSKMAKGDKLDLDQTFVIQRKEGDADGIICVASPRPTDVDYLMKTVVPLHTFNESESHDSAHAATNAKSK